ncbi:MAG: ABC transporter ATP-binding protein [Actinomycetes bacterium]
MNSGSAVKFEKVSKRFRTPKGTWYQALANLEFEVEAGQFVALVGPTGCGKSTALTLLAGLEQPSIGKVTVNGQEVHDIDTSTGFVFQHDATFPWMNVYSNIAAGPKFRKVKDHDALVKLWIAKVGLTGFENNYPHQLSGGMKKRVALAQSLINEPSLLLMDEPFSALDVQTRSIMTDELMGLWEQTKSTVLFVTHDLEEAIALADRVIVLTAGPAQVKADFKIDLPRPRKARDIRFTPEFLAIYHKIWNVLRDEVDLAYQRQLIAPSGKK